MGYKYINKSNNLSIIDGASDSEIESNTSVCNKSEKQPLPDLQVK